MTTRYTVLAAFLLCMLVLSLCASSAEADTISCSTTGGITVECGTNLLDCDQFRRLKCANVVITCTTEDGTTVTTPDEIAEKCPEAFAHLELDVSAFFTKYEELKKSCSCEDTPNPEVEYTWGCTARNATNGSLSVVDCCSLKPCQQQPQVPHCVNALTGEAVDPKFCDGLDMPPQRDRCPTTDPTCFRAVCTNHTTTPTTLSNFTPNDIIPCPQCGNATSCREQAEQAAASAHVAYWCLSMYTFSQTAASNCYNTTVNESHFTNGGLTCKATSSSSSSPNDSCAPQWSCAAYDVIKKVWTKKNCCDETTISQCQAVDQLYCFVGNEIVPNRYCPARDNGNVYQQCDVDTTKCYTPGCFNNTDGTFLPHPNAACSCPKDPHCNTQYIRNGCMSTANGTFVRPSNCQLDSVTVCQGTPSACEDTTNPAKYEPRCIAQDGSIVPCDCEALGGGRGNEDCKSNQYHAFVCVDTAQTPNAIVASSYCQGMLVNGQSFDRGVFYCATTSTQACAPQLYCSYTDKWGKVWHGPCTCGDKWEANAYTVNATTIPTTWVRPSFAQLFNHSDWCEREGSTYPLTPTCLNALTLQPIALTHCQAQLNATNISANGLQCPCDEEVDTKPPEWQCVAYNAMNGAMLVVPCDEENICKNEQISLLDPTALCRGVRVQKRCMRNGLQVAESICLAANLTPPQLPPNNICQDDTACRHHWLCTLHNVNGTTSTAPCDYMTRQCSWYRETQPCGPIKLTHACVNSVTGQQVADTLCTPQFPSTAEWDAYINKLCPPRHGCDEKKYDWVCSKYHLHNETITTGNIFFNLTAPSDEYKKQCHCQDGCEDYKLFAQCVDRVTGLPVGDDLCEQSGRPQDFFCPATLPPTRCGGDDPKCTLFCFDGEVSMPCDMYQVYCDKIGKRRCGVTTLEAKCGSLIFGQFVPAEEESCCKDAGILPPWYDDHGVGSNTWTCEKPRVLPTRPNFRPTTSSSSSAQSSFLTQAATTIVAEDVNPCKYAFLCTHPISGSLVPCDCEKMQYYDFFNPATGAMEVKKYCKEIALAPKCYEIDPYSGAMNVVSDALCNAQGLTAPAADVCKPKDCDVDHYAWLCSPHANTNTTAKSDFMRQQWQQCSCEDFTKQYKMCGAFNIQAKCFKYTTSQPTIPILVDDAFECYQALGGVGPFHPQHDLTWQTCKGDLSYCEDETVVEQGCLLNGNPMYPVSCNCSEVQLPEVYQHHCQFSLHNIHNNIIRVKNTTHFALPPRVIEPPTAQVYLCDQCLTDVAWQHILKCFVNNQEVPCDYCPLPFVNTCDTYSQEAKCFATRTLANGVVETVPAAFSQCTSKFLTLQQQQPNWSKTGTNLCTSPQWTPACSAEWLCAVNFTEHRNMADVDNKMSLQLANATSSYFPCPRSCDEWHTTGCQQFQITPYCVVTTPDGTQQVVDESYCTDSITFTALSTQAQRTKNPLQLLNQTTTPASTILSNTLKKPTTLICPEKLHDDWCNTATPTYEWRCTQTNDVVTNNTSISRPKKHWSCHKPTCPKLNCGEAFTINAECYQVFTQPGQNTVYTLTSSSNCDATQWPILDPTWNQPVSLYCPHNCPQIEPEEPTLPVCLNGAINYPRCHIFALDAVWSGVRGNEVVLVPGSNITLGWNNNNATLCTDTSAVLSIVTTTTPFSRVVGRVNVTRFANATIAFPIDFTHYILPEQQDVEAYATVEITFCGNVFTTPTVFEIDTTKVWCTAAAKKRCAESNAPFTHCDEKTKSCVCPPGTFGEKCEQKTAQDELKEKCAKLGMIPDYTTSREGKCVCPRKDQHFDEALQKCIRTTPEQPCKPQSDDDAPETIHSAEQCTAANGVFDEKQCLCKCPEGFAIETNCKCQERFFRLVFASKPEGLENFAADWEAELIKYIQYHLTPMLPGTDYPHGVKNVTIFRVQDDVNGGGVFTVELRVVICGGEDQVKFVEDLINKLRQLVEIYQAYYSEHRNNNNNDNNAMQMLEAIDILPPTYEDFVAAGHVSLLSTDVAKSGGGIVATSAPQKSTAYPINPNQQNNHAQNIVMSSATLILAIIVGIVSLF